MTDRPADTGRQPVPEAASRRRGRLPPRWFVVTFWHVHRAVVRVTRGRVGLWRPKAGGWGALWLTTTGRRSGWLNLQAHPEALAQTKDGARPVRGRRAQGAERDRLWARWSEVDRDLDAYAARRPGETAVVVLELSPAPPAAAHSDSAWQQGLCPSRVAPWHAAHGRGGAR